MRNVKSTAKGKASLVMGILGLVLIITPYFGLPLSILATMYASNQNKIVPTGNSNAGNTLGIIGIIINSIMLLIVLLAIIFTAGKSFTTGI